MGKIDGKVAMITGSGSGIGRASAILFAQEGTKVVVNCRTVKTGEETVKLIRKDGGEALFVKADVSKEEDVKNLIRKTISAYGRLDILFNNAGLEEGIGDITQITEKQWNTTVSTNLTGTWLGMKYAIPEMLRTGGGVIISTSSICGFIQMSNVGADYSASKAGIIMLTKMAAAQFAPQNIKVNCICPGHVATPLFEKSDIAGNEENRRKLNNMPLRGRVGTSEEIARVALFLACDDSSYITGEALVVDGGHTVLSRGYEPGYGVLSA